MSPPERRNRPAQPHHHRRMITTGAPPKFHEVPRSSGHPQSQTAEAGGGGSPARCLIVDDAARGTPARGATYFSRRVRPLALSSMAMPMIVASMIVPKMLITAVRSSFTVPKRQPPTESDDFTLLCGVGPRHTRRSRFDPHFHGAADPGSIDSRRPGRRRGLGVRLQLSGTFRM
jgi:hypothetical protein